MVTDMGHGFLAQGGPSTGSVLRLLLGDLEPVIVPQVASQAVP